MRRLGVEIADSYAMDILLRIGLWWWLLEFWV